MVFASSITRRMQPTADAHHVVHPLGLEGSAVPTLVPARVRRRRVERAVNPEESKR
jgi:hypothetical protein